MGRSNGIKPDRYDLTRELPDGRCVVVPLLLQRNPSGDWTFKLQVTFIYNLPDGRIVSAQRHLAIGSVLQVGRKPRAKETKRRKKRCHR